MTKREKEDERVFRLVAWYLRGYAEKYRMTLRKVSRTRPTNSFFGWCLKGEIAMTVRWKNGKQLHAYALVDTMAHELAHLRYPSHSQRWALRYSSIFHDMVRSGVYKQMRKVVKRKP